MQLPFLNLLCKLKAELRFGSISLQHVIFRLFLLQGNGDAPTPSPDDDDEALSPSNGRTLQATAFKWSLDHAFHSASRMLEETTVVAAPAPAPILVDFPGGGVQVSDQGVHVQFPGGAVNIGRKLKALTVT